MIHEALESLVAPDAVLAGDFGHYLSDETEGRGVRGRADAVVFPTTTAEVARVVAWCYSNDVPITPRGGGTGFAGGAVPLDGGVVVSLERMNRVTSFDPLLWRARVEAGVRTADVRRIARDNGLFFPPDPGAADQSHIGGNIATNAGGPHAFKYGVTGAWISGLEAVVPPGEVISVGGPIRKDVAGYDIKNLLVGSEGTLGIITAAWLRFLPAPEAFLPVVAFYSDVQSGCDAIERVLGSGLRPSALEYLDAGAIRAAGPAFPAELPGHAEFMIIAEADGSADEAQRLQQDLLETLREDALGVVSVTMPREVAQIWRWRDGVSIAVTAQRGGKVSEDVVVPIDRLREAIAKIVEIGRRHDLYACSWGHAGDGNLHATFMIDPADERELAAAEPAAAELFDLALGLGGSVSGEHGIGWVKRGQLERQWNPPTMRLHRRVKDAFDPKNLLNPRKKL